MTSTPSISRLLIRAWAPVSFIGGSLQGAARPTFRVRAGSGGSVPGFGSARPEKCPVTYEAPRQGEGRKRTDAMGRRALRNDYEEGRGEHRTTIVAAGYPVAQVIEV